MENKYYTPNLIEFHNEFEYEVYIPEKEKWSKETFYLNKEHIDLIKYVDIQDDNTLRKVRVKYLDKEDIESLGFITIKHDGGWNYQLDKYLLYFRESDGHIQIRNSNREEPALFTGWIKNKSELKQVLKMIGVL